MQIKNWNLKKCAAAAAEAGITAVVGVSVGLLSLSASVFKHTSFSPFFFPASYFLGFIDSFPFLECCSVRRLSLTLMVVLCSPNQYFNRGGKEKGRKNI